MVRNQSTPFKRLSPQWSDWLKPEGTRIMTHMIRLPLIALLLILLGCASSNEPIIDTKGVDMTVYEQDLAECKTYSEEIDSKTGVAKGAAAGGAVGGAAGAIGGGNMGRSAGVGAVLGAASSAFRANDDKATVVKRCLAGRGYKVLN